TVRLEGPSTLPPEGRSRDLPRPSKSCRQALRPGQLHFLDQGFGSLESTHYLEDVMQIIKYDGRPKIRQVELKADPLSIWLDARAEMRIERGDRLGDIAEVVLRQGWGLEEGSARKLVAYWF